MSTLPPSSEAQEPEALQPSQSSVTEEDIAPSRAMEYWLFGIMAASLAVSISGLAFVYGFDLNHFFSPTNISPGVRGVIVDSIMFLGVYFTRRFLMHRPKRAWHWFWGVVWLLVAVLATGFSWFSNTLAVNELGTTVTQQLLNKAGFEGWDAAEVNQVIAALPIVAVLLYGIVPRRMKTAPRMVDTRTPEQILQEAQQDAARIQAARIVRQARATEVGESIGEGVSAVTRGLNTALGRDPQAAHAAKAAREDALRQMRVLLLRHGWVESLDKAMKMKPEQVQLLAETKQLWNMETNQPMPWALLPTKAEKRDELRKLAMAHQWLTAKDVAQEDEMGYAELEARYVELEQRAESVRAEEAARQAEAQLLMVPAAPHQEPVNDPLSSHLPPLLVQIGGGDSTQGATKQDGFTPEELAKRLGKSRGTIINWMKDEAKPPFKIYAEEIFLTERGYQRITADAFLRLSRALEEEGAFTRGDSAPRKAVSKAAMNGKHEEGPLANTEGTPHPL
jgi:hypothetical protein